MHRAIRYLLRASIVVSGILCVATVAIWVRSYWAGYETFSESAVKQDPHAGSMSTISERAYQMVCGSGGVRALTAKEVYRDTYIHEGGGPVFAYNSEQFDDAAPHYPQASPQWGPVRWQWAHLGVAVGLWEYRLRSSTGSVRWVIFPLWLPALLTAVLPATAAAKRSLALRLRRTRLASGRCPCCGYDMRASQDECPECGAPAQLPGCHATSAGESDASASSREA